MSAHGYGRSTKNVDFLVGDEAFEHHQGGLVSMRPGVPIQVSGVLIDFLSVGDDEKHLEAALSNGGEIAPIDVLVYLKLKSPRAKDRVDVIEVIKAGADVNRCRVYLTAHAAILVPKFDDCVTVAQGEES